MLTRLTASLNLPVIGSPMFIVSGPELVIAQCQAGILGAFPALNARPADVLREWLQQITQTLADYDAQHPEQPSAPFAVNQIVHPTNDRLEHDVALCAEFKVPLVITSLHAPNQVVEKVHAYGGLVFHDVTTLRHAKKAIDAGVDGLILVCHGAGGHAGRLNPFAFVAEVRRFYDGPLVLAGAISKGEQIVAAQALGVDLVYMGTRFIATQEANAQAAYKLMVLDAAAGDIVYTNLFTGVHGNYLRQSIEQAGLDPDALPEGDKTAMRYGSGGSSKAKAWRDIWGAGQGVGAIASMHSVAEEVATLRQDYQKALDHLRRL
ncbi:nitronate monooxygenase [Halomonas sp. ATBC28]|jgi:nitronate monooxygenase|uniref:NAD(P)H-dependent flavin oxidoreductase n=1 Tax=Halomonadaceae TaxID=28256 RepID=UPI0004858675|nr:MULTISPECIES: nitronate monooxygenase family protein [unclassified Halomonas]NAO98603.1 nitronate monooxygenase [Halomonas sp. MG34]QGQ70663.1 nitronate monooxygenase [Halomonas sp. PA16-9]UEQ02016.1 nitronate monooxygenase family protein [Halomonas profundus]PKH59376.1 nitronate monooxygenase [Halomonas sp. Choline-3u-9]TMU14836.1 nitronate monooxygenase [Halomonas sp. ATBC28]